MNYTYRVVFNAHDVKAEFTTNAYGIATKVHTELSERLTNLLINEKYDGPYNLYFARLTERGDFDIITRAYKGG